MYARYMRSPLIPTFTRPTILTRSTLIRLQSQYPFPRGLSQKPQYNRFSRVQAAKTLWKTSPAFRLVAGVIVGSTTTFIVYNIEKTPISGRRRFNWVSAQYEQEMGKLQYQQIMQEYQRSILPDSHPHVKMVRKVLKKLIPNSNLEGQEWEVHVIHDPTLMNAFVIPGGKVFVFSGLLPICAGEDGLATVLGHEIAHNAVHHVAENFSRLSLILPLALGASLTFDVSSYLTYMMFDYAYNRPGSRAQESEADFIGLMMMAQSCYDPEAAIEFWARMEKAEKTGGMAVPQFLSTHPSSHNRVGKMKGWLAQALDKRAQSECGATVGYMDDFRRAFVREGKDFSRFW